MVAEKKKDFYTGLFFENTGQPNENFFDHVEEVKGDKKKKSSNNEKNLITARQLNDHFVTIGPELSYGFQKQNDFSKLQQIQILSSCHKLINRKFMTR